MMTQEPVAPSGTGRKEENLKQI